MLRLMNTCYVYILSSRDHRHLSIRATADLRHGIRHHRRRLAQQTGRKKLYQKMVFVESFAGISSAVERSRELEGMTRSQLFRLINRRNPTWRALSVSGYLARRERSLRVS